MLQIDFEGGGPTPGQAKNCIFACDRAAHADLGLTMDLQAKFKYNMRRLNLLLGVAAVSALHGCS